MAKDVTRITPKGKEMAAYQKEQAVLILDKVAEGQTLVDIAGTEGLPTRQTIYRWLTLYPDFFKAFEAARELSAQSMEDEALGIARKLAAPNEYTGVRVQALKEAMVQFRWSAARRDPKRFGSSTPQTAVTVPVQINTTLDLNSKPTNDTYSFTVTREVVVPQAEDEPADAEVEEVDIPEAVPYDAPEVAPARLMASHKKGGPPVGHPSYNTRTNTARRREVLAKMAAKRQGKKDVRGNSGSTKRGSDGGSGS